MKILKLLFGKTFVVFLALILQILVICGFVSYLNQYYLVFQIISFILGIVSFMGLLNKKQTPEFKIPWMFLMLTLPLFGLTLYWLFAKNGVPKTYAKKMKRRQKDCLNYLTVSDTEKEKLYAAAGDYLGVEKYLVSTAQTYGRLNNRVEYFSTGGAFYKDFLQTLKSAEKFIFMEYFIIDEGVLWDSVLSVLEEKVKAGVKVKILYDDIGTLGKLRGGYYKKLRKLGIECYKFNPFRPIVSGIYNNRDHRKITVIDGKTGYTGGINLADEYINAKTLYGHWKDTAVKIQGSCVNDMTVTFIQIFDVVSGQVTDLKEYINAKPKEYADGGVVHFFGDGPNPIDNELIGLNNYINLINKAKDYVYITTPYLVPDFSLISALRNQALAGVDVRIVTPSVPDKKFIFNVTQSNYKTLIEAGVKIYEYTPGFMHAKGLVSDDKAAFVGTINLDFRSFVHHFECGAVLTDVPCIKDIKKDFLDTLEVSKRINENDAKFNLLRTISVSILNLFSPML